MPSRLSFKQNADQCEDNYTIVTLEIWTFQIFSKIVCDIIWCYVFKKIELQQMYDSGCFFDELLSHYMKDSNKHGKVINKRNFPKCR